MGQKIIGSLKRRSCSLSSPILVFRSTRFFDVSPKGQTDGFLNEDYLPMGMGPKLTYWNPGINIHKSTIWAPARFWRSKTLRNSYLWWCGYPSWFSLADGWRIPPCQALFGAWDFPTTRRYSQSGTTIATKTQEFLRAMLALAGLGRSLREKNLRFIGIWLFFLSTGALLENN